MRILIADSGSTKTNWQEVDSEFNPVKKWVSQGINPYYQDRQQIRELVKTELPGLQADSIYFYGAGCSVDDKKQVVADALCEALSCTTIRVDHDLIGTCRSLLGRKKGIAGILGTGSNSCVSENGEITHHIPSLGFILGDEGSGGHIGKTFIKAFLDHTMPESIKKDFLDKFNLNREIILEMVYRKPMPNRYLAGFAKYVGEVREEEWTRQLLTDCFTEFFKLRICRYPEYEKLPLGLSGSIAWAFSEEITEVARVCGMKGDLNFTQDPLPGLVKFHSEY